MTTTDKTLYIHVPFCVRRCIYCAFYLEPLGTGPISKRLRDYDQSDNSRFIRALETELAQLPEDFCPSSIYIGGGTPTELSQTDFKGLFTAITRNVDTQSVQEWTVEANPGTLVDEKIVCMREQGVNRISLGTQTFDPATLEFLGRLHTPEEAHDTFQRLRKAGCNNISLDLIVAIPGRSAEVLQRDIDTVLELAPEHASAYALELDPGAPLFALREKGMFSEMDDDEAADQYHLLRAALDQGGLHQYEVSNFARPGYESIHNQHYWQAGEYAGCGPSAAGHINGTRTVNIANLDQYCKRLEAGESPVDQSETLNPEAKARETLMLALRTRKGLDAAAFLTQTGFSITALAGDTIADYLKQGFMEHHEGRLRLTEQALFISDGLFVDLL